MTDIIGGLLMMSGGGMLLGSGLQLVRAPRRDAEAIAAALPHTPLAPPDPDLDALLASID